MATPLNLMATPRTPVSGRGWDPYSQAKPTAKSIVPTNGAGTVAGTSVLNQPFVTPGGAGAGTVGNSYKPFRVGGG